MSIISRAFEERRRSIFTEIDRPGAESTWKQILESCLSVIEAVDSRLEDARVPPPELTLTSHTDKDIKKIPKLSAPLRMDRILQASPKAKNRTEWAESEIGALAKSMGHNKGKAKHGSPGRLFLKSVALQIIPEQWEKNQSREIVSSIQSIASQSWFTSITTPFRQTFAARVQAKVFGTPRSEFPAILFSIYSISRLAVAGITEDTMGTVNQDIPLIMRTFGNAIGRIQKFIDESHVHWTDVRSTKGVDDSKRVEEVKFLIGYLRAALGHIINGYEGFARDMGIAPSELKAARIAAGQAQV